MSALNTNTDLTEEDAADLQFPKELNNSKSSVHFNINQCAHCETELTDSFILCVTCDLNLCKDCFANGVEFENHKSDHNYKVLTDECVIFPTSDWTAKEEMILLNGLLTHSNWITISKQLENRTIKDIKEHYDNYYLKKCGSDLFPDVKTVDNIIEPIIPYRFKLNNIQDPLRNNENTPAGYNAARSDFEYNYDKNAEDVICNLESLDTTSPFYNILSELQVTIANSYRQRMLERQRRRQIIREHGLIMPQKTTAWLHRYSQTLTPAVYDKMVRFMQFYTGKGFEYIMEGLHRAGELKIQIARLCEYRKQGIPNLEEAQVYLKLKRQREESLKEIKRFQHISELTIKYKSFPIQVNIATSKRRSMTPLEIIGMPGYDKLLLNERDLCSTIRLPPLNYLDLKAVLISENNKLGYLKLLTARRLLKIDVNKTRKLYDFLINQGYIKKPKE